MKKKFASIGAIALGAFAPLLAFAQTSTSATSVCTNNQYQAGAEYVICRIYDIIKILIPVLILGAVAYFIWGVINYVIAGDSEEKTSAKSVMIHGIIGFAVILGLWGLVNLLLGTFGLNNAAGPGILPTF